MEDIDLLSDGIFDDGEWISWNEISWQLQCKEWSVKYPNGDQSLIPVFEDLLGLAQNYFLQNDRHLAVYGDIGELFGAITFGIRLNRNYAQGSDGRLGNDHVEIKTISPFKSKDFVTIDMKGNFNKLLVVKISDDFEVSARMIHRKSIKPSKSGRVKIRWDNLPIEAS